MKTPKKQLDNTATKIDLKKLGTNLSQKMSALEKNIRKDMATKTDLKKLKTDLRQEMAGMGKDIRQEMAGMGKDIRQEMAGMGKDIRQEMAGMGKDIKQEMDTMNNKINKLAIDYLDMKEDIKKIKENMATKDDINKILSAVDAAIGQYQEIKIEQLSNQAAHERFEADITKLKVHTGLKV